VKSTNSNALNLYAKVEDMLGVKDVAPKLYAKYFQLLKDIEFDSLLDIGCGSGEFLQIVDSLAICNKTLGIDRSNYMVKSCKQKGVNAKCIELCDIDEQFDVAVATFDMINYLTPQEFDKFFNDLSKVVKKGGYFIFDINSLYGLSELAVGNFIEQDKTRFLTIESFFENNIYESYFTLFEKQDNNCYVKQEEQINQYYYSVEKFETLKVWRLVDKLPFSLYELDCEDKYFVIIQNST